jgi:hypothetical protein
VLQAGAGWGCHSGRPGAQSKSSLASANKLGTGVQMNGDRLGPEHGLVAVYAASELVVSQLRLCWQLQFKLPLQLETSLSQVQVEAPHSGWHWAWILSLTREAT